MKHLCFVLLGACAAAPRPPLQLGFAVAHAAPAYPRGAATLKAGADAAEALHADSIKVYLTPNIAEKYQDEAWPKLTSVSALADTPALRALFARPFRVFVLTTYTFANGITGGFSDGFDELEAAAEYAELRALAEHLLRTYKGSGKRFVLQNWEGDFAARGGFEPGRRAADAAVSGMEAWIRTRQKAVTDARHAVGEVGVHIDHAFELNALEDGSHNVGERIVSRVCTDLVSYSSWEAMRALYDQAPDAIVRSARALDAAVSRLRRAACPSAALYLGEIGIAENELPASLKESLGEWLAAIAPTLKRIAGGIWWQIYDNECRAEQCRGFWLLRPDGSKSVLLRALQN